MTLLTGIQKILLAHFRFRIIGRFDIMDSMAIVTDGFIEGGSRPLFKKELRCCTMKIGYIRLEYLSGEAIFAHQSFISVATGADLGRLQAEACCMWVLDLVIVNAMAVDTGGHIRIIV